MFANYLAAVLVVALAMGVPALGLDARLQVSQYQKQHWQMEDGLPHNYVFATLRAPDGYLLVGTDEGLARFDGTRFVPFDLDPSIGLSKRWIVCLTLAHDGSIWIGTFDGGLYQWQNGRLLTRIERASSVFDIAEDGRGRIWASTRNGVIRSGPHNNRFENVPELRRPPDTAWNVLAVDQSGAVWTVTADGLYRTGEHGTQCVARSGKDYGESLSVRADGARILAGTSQGLYALADSRQNAALEKISGVPGPVVAMLRDRNGNLWAGTWGQGLFRKTQESVQRWSSHDGLADDFVRHLSEDEEGSLWIGLRGGGLSRWKDPSLAPFGIPEGLGGDYASTVALDANNTLWLGTWRGGLYRAEHDRLLSQPTPAAKLFFTVRALAIDPHGDLWTGNWEGLYRWNGNRWQHFAGPEAPYRHISVVLFDAQGRLWIATSDNGIFVFAHGVPDSDPEHHFLAGKEVTALVKRKNRPELWAGTPQGAGWISEAAPDSFHALSKTHDESFTGLSADAQGRVWACTLNGSLWRLDVAGGEAIQPNQGLPGYPLYLALDDGRGALWMSSPRGILRLDESAIDRAFHNAAAQVEYRLFDREDGMRTIECHRQSQPAGGRDAQGRLWFPTSKGFIRIDPATFHQPAAAPPVRIEETKVDGQMRPGPFKLDPGQHAVEIRFTALEFRSPQKLQFRYRMLGLESQWTSAPSTRLARYTHLPPGEFTFQVAAAVAGGPWSPAATLDFRQLPEFYQTRWFQILVALSAVGAATGILRWQTHLFRQRYLLVTAERNRIAREWHDTLLAGFSAISLQLEAAMLEPREISSRVREILAVARKMVQHYRAEARRVIWDLRETNSDQVTLGKAVRSALHKAVEGRNIVCELDCSGTEIEAPKDLEHNLLRVCQEALANAVHHANPRLVRVELRYVRAGLTVRVSDDGIGFDLAETRSLKNGHFGLTIMEERVRKFGGTLLLRSEPGKGTVVEAVVPIPKGARSV